MDVNRNVEKKKPAFEQEGALEIVLDNPEPSPDASTHVTGEKCCNYDCQCRYHALEL